MILFFILGLLITAYIINKIYFGKTSLDFLKKEVDKLHKIYKAEYPNLVQWHDYDIDLLSYHVSGKSISKGFGHTIRGVFTSIYQEPMMIFQHRGSEKKKQNGYSILITKDHEILIDGKNHVFVNRELLGILNAKNEFINPKLRRKFGFLEEEKFNKKNIFGEDDLMIGAVKNPEDWELPFPRAAELYQKLDDHHRLLFKILCGQEMVQIYHQYQSKK